MDPSVFRHQSEVRVRNYEVDWHENLAVHVWLDSVTGEPITVPEHFRSTVQAFEGVNLLNPGSPTIT